MFGRQHLDGKLIKEQENFRDFKKVIVAYKAGGGGGGRGIVAGGGEAGEWVKIFLESDFYLILRVVFQGCLDGWKEGGVQFLKRR